MKTNYIFDGIFGLVVGDYLGVPVEFKDRESLKENPVIGIREFGTHGQPKGTWSDDSSLTFCLAESLLYGYDLNDIASNFLKWRKAEIWTPHGSVFDIGIATKHAIYKFEQGEQPLNCGGRDDYDNGNGSLMRIFPLLLELKDETDLNKIYSKVKEVSSITHAHFRSVFACFIYVIFAQQIISGKSKFEALELTKKVVDEFTLTKDFNDLELKHFDRILNTNIPELSEHEIKSSGYVIYTLEASLWCVLTSNSYEETVLKAINLGEDTDTTAAISGSLAGLIYGFNSIPNLWIDTIVKKEQIFDLCEKLTLKYQL